MIKYISELSPNIFTPLDYIFDSYNFFQVQICPEYTRTTLPT